MYRTWFGAFSPAVEVRAVQLPGRESRLKEPRITNATVLAHHIADAIAGCLDRPFALFGYSLGAMLAFETARELRRRGIAAPACLFAAAMHAPQVSPARSKLSHLPNDQFIEQVDCIYQPVDAVWQIPEMREILLPILRDDIAIADGYSYVQQAPLSCPIEAFAGKDDQSLPAGSVEAWREQTTAEFNTAVFPGGHFFLHEFLPHLQAKVGCRLAAIMRERCLVT
jgi:surfactin synthase thioesterase subunit